jgi:hypothetical protein
MRRDPLVGDCDEQICWHPFVGDEGIESDPAVVFAEDFEARDLEGVWARWASVRNRGIMSLPPEVAVASGGRRSLLMTPVGGQSTGGHMSRVWFDGLAWLAST